MAEDFDSLVELLRRNTDEFGWLQPLLDDPDSLAALGGVTAVFALLGPAVIHNRDAGLISASSGGQNGTCTARLVRAAGPSGTIPAGYPFVDPRGCRLITQTDVAVAFGQTVVFLPLVTVRQTELVNTVDDPGLVVAPDAPSVIADASISNLIAPAGDLANSAVTFTAADSSTPIQGGAVDYLAVHGSERGLLRQPGEGEASYRARIRNIPDAVSPIAVADVVAHASQAPGLPAFEVLEPFRDGADPVEKELHRLGSFDIAAFDAAPPPGNADFLDDELVEMGDRRTATAYIRIKANDYVRDQGTLAMFYDDGFFDDDVHGYADAWINFPPAALAAILAILHGVQQVKAGGVNVDIYLRDPDVVYGVGASSSGSLTQVFDLAAPVGSSWLVVEIAAGMDSPNPVPAANWALVFTLLDTSTITITGKGPKTVRAPLLVSKVVRRIQGKVQSNGSTAVNLVMTMRSHVLARLS